MTAAYLARNLFRVEVPLRCGLLGTSSELRPGIAGELPVPARRITHAIQEVL